MREHMAGGCYRIRRYEGDGRWIFAGAFYWVNHYYLFIDKDWDDFEPSKWVPEAYFLSRLCWTHTFDFYTRIAVNCPKCGLHNWTPDAPVDPRFTACPACHSPLINNPIVPSDIDDTDDVTERTRHLIYNFCPQLDAIPVILDHLEQLKKYSHVFTGRQIINIKTGDGLMLAQDSVKHLRAIFPFAEFREFRNQPELGEYVGFLDAFKSLIPQTTHESICYAHTKGVASYNLKPERRYHSVRQ